jgi:hypothetical protein
MHSGYNPTTLEFTAKTLYVRERKIIIITKTRHAIFALKFLQRWRCTL